MYKSSSHFANLAFSLLGLCVCVCVCVFVCVRIPILSPFYSDIELHFHAQ